MIYESDITYLVSQWETNRETMNVNDCITGLKNLVEKSQDEEQQRFYDPTDLMTPEELKEYWEDMEAEYWVDQQKNSNIYYS